MRPIALSIVLAALCVSTSAAAQAPIAARDIAATCANCHGTNGTSRGVVPSLAGQTRSDLATKMLEFKQNKRTGTIMPQLAKGYTDEQIELIAGWFAAQKAK
jgi:cytochrome c553